MPATPAAQAHPMSTPTRHRTGSATPWEAGRHLQRTLAPLLVAVATASVTATATANTTTAGIPSFRHDVMPIFSKAGCNTGACHGSAGGKGKLKLSLRGESAEEDYAALTAGGNGRYLSLDQPTASRLLRKPAALTDHEGGQKFTPESESFQLLRDWIAGGAPLDPPSSPTLTAVTVTPDQGLVVEPTREIALATTAHFSDGTTRDITRWAVYEPSNLLVTVSASGVVRAQKSGETTVVARFEHLQTPVRLAFIPDRAEGDWKAPPPRNEVDVAVWDKLRQMRLPPSATCDDATFARRAWLDLTGRLPSGPEAKNFVADPTSDKRDRLIDSLLSSPEFADHWALKWADLLRVEERILDVTGVTAFHRWIRESVATDRPLDQFARDIVSGLGSTYQNPPANFYRALREPTLRAEAVAQVFLGTRLGCAKCHNHPFERWTQNDYHQFAAVFDQIDYTVLRNDRRDENDQLEFIGEQIVVLGGPRKLKHPKTGAEPAPAFLGEPNPPAGPGHTLTQLADWMTRPGHPLFDRVMTNRIWSHLMGSGLVDPIDDFRLTNPPSNPALLDALTAYFIQHGRRAQPLIRLICQSRTWQLSSTPLPANRDDLLNHSHQVVRRLPAEPLLDAVHQVLGLAPVFAHYPATTTAAAIPGVKLGGRGGRTATADRFLKDFGKPPRTTVCGCERSNESSLSQVFTLTSGPGLASLLTHPDNRLTALTAPEITPSQAVEDLFWAALSRAPSAEETTALSPLLADPATRRAALEDITWSLINAKEFLLRH